MLSKIIAFFMVAAMTPTICAFAENDANEYHNTTESCDEYYNYITSDGSLYRTQYYRLHNAQKNDNESAGFFATQDMVSQKVSEDAVSVARDYVLKEDKSLWKIDDTPSHVADNVKEVSSSGGHTLFVKYDNTLWGIGDNSLGQLAQGKLDKSLEQQISENLGHRNKTKCTPEEFNEPIMIMDDVKSAVAYGAHSIVLKKDGSVWTFGDDYIGQLGLGVKDVVNNTPTQILTGIKKIFSSGEACFAIDNNNTLWRWGTNYTGYSGGECVLKPEKYIKDAMSVYNMPSYNLVVKTDNSLWIYGDSETDGGDISKESLKITDDVADVRGLDYMDDNDGLNGFDKALVLKNDGTLMLLTLPLCHSDDLSKELTMETLKYNVMLPHAISETKNFDDISDKSNEVQKSVKSLAKANIISGTSEREFSPGKPITRAEIAAILLRMTAKNDEDANGGFEDVTADKWYYNTAGASRKYNIVAGFEDNTFRGDETISKVQLISLATRTLRNEGRVTEAVYVTDINAPEWAVNDLSLALQGGLISQNDLKDIDGSMTRADAAVILYKLYEKI